MAYTQLQFREVIRQRLGWPATDNFVTDGELNSFINDSLAELHSLLVTVFKPGQWGLIAEAVITSPGVGTYALVQPFGRLIVVRLLYQGRATAIRAMDVTVDDFETQSRSWTPDGVRYVINVAGPDVTITFSPPPDSVETVLFYTVRAAPILAADGDTSFMEYDEYVVLDVMIKCREKEEADASSLVGQKSAFQARIRQQAEPLDLGQASYVQDARALDDRGGNTVPSQWFWR